MGAPGRPLLLTTPLDPVSRKKALSAALLLSLSAVVSPPLILGELTRSRQSAKQYVIIYFVEKEETLPGNNSKSRRIEMATITPEDVFKLTKPTDGCFFNPNYYYYFIFSPAYDFLLHIYKYSFRLYLQRYAFYCVFAGSHNFLS